METERFIDGRCDVINSVQSGHGIKRRTKGRPYMSVSSRPVKDLNNFFSNSRSNGGE